MDYRLVDVLYSNQLEVNDLIGLGDEVVKILSIESTKEGFTLLVENDYRNYVDLMLPPHYATKKFIPERLSIRKLTNKY